jgi:hypothetical protein
MEFNPNCRTYGADTINPMEELAVDSLSITSAMNTSLSNFARRAVLAVAILVAAAASSAIVAGCEREGPAERAGKDVDRAARKTGDALKDAGNEIKKTTR